MTRRSALFAGLAIAAVIAAIPPDPGPSPSTPSITVDSQVVAQDSTPLVLTKLQMLNIAMIDIAPTMAISASVDQVLAFRRAHQAHRNPVAVVGCYPERTGSMRLSTLADSNRTCRSFAWRAHRNHRPPSTS